MFPKDETFAARYHQRMSDIKRMNRETILHAYRTRLNLYLSDQKELTGRVASGFFDIEVDITEKNPIFENRLINYFSNEKIAVFTAIYGSCDQLVEPLTVPDNCHFYVFTDQAVPDHSVWKKVDIAFNQYNLEDASDRMKSRFVKMHAHLFFKDYRYSLYLDGNIQLLTDPTEFIEQMNGYGVIMHDDYRVDCAYDEIKRCQALNLLTEEEATNLEGYLEEKALSRDYGFLESPVVFRDHQNEIGKEMMEEWWQEFKKQGKLDEISLPVVLYRRGIRTLELAGLGYDLYSNYAFRKMQERRNNDEPIAYYGKVTT